jgi:hypothetical protein
MRLLRKPHKKQSGMVALLLVLAMVAGLLWMSIAIHHRVDGLQKQTQIQWSLTQSFWTAEAGLECAYIQLKHSGSLSHKCGLMACDIDVVAIPNGWLVSAKSGNITLRKGFNSASQRWIEGSWIDY